MADYLIVGGGMNGAAAARAIREVDAQGNITILGEEPHRPYSRPPLSKALWKGEAEEKIWLELPPGVELVQGRAVSIDRAAREVKLADGSARSYRKLLLATGGTPRRLPF